MIRWRPAVFVFVVAAVLRAAYAFICYRLMGAEGLMGPDSTGFLDSAQFLADGGSVMQVATDTTTGFALDLMPIAFWLMSLTLAPSGIATGAPDPLFYILLQSVIDAGTCILIGLIAARFNPRLFLPAALIACFNPTQIVVAGLAYTDTTFLFFACAGLLASVVWLQGPSWFAALGVGAFAGLALMTRPFMLYWIVILPVVLLALHALRMRVSAFRRLPQLVLVVIVAFAIASPIALRNHDRFGTFQLSAQAGDHLLFWIVPLVREFSDGTPRDVSKARGDRLYAEWPGPPPDGPFERSARYKEIAKQELGDLGMATVAGAWVTGAVLNLLAPAAAISPPVSSLPRSSFFATEGDNLLQKVEAFLFKNEGGTYAAVLLASGALVLVWLVLGLGGVAVSLYAGRGSLALVLLMLLWAGYILGLNGPVVSPKYRLPMEPAWVVFAAIGWMALKDRMLIWKQSRNLAKQPDGEGAKTR